MAVTNDPNDPNFKFKSARQTPPEPPRETGQQQTDQRALIDWLWQFYLATVVESGLLDPVYQAIVGEISFDSLPDPEATTISRAQATANAAWTAGEQFKFDVENKLKTWHFGGEFTIANGATTANPVFEFDLGTNDYFVVASAVGGAGAPNNDAFRVIAVTKGTGGIGVTVAGAPGGGSSVTYNYTVTGKFPDLGGVDSSEEED